MNTRYILSLFLIIFFSSSLIVSSTAEKIIDIDFSTDLGEIDETMYGVVDVWWEHIYNDDNDTWLRFEEVGGTYQFKQEYLDLLSELGVKAFRYGGEGTCIFNWDYSIDNTQPFNRIQLYRGSSVVTERTAMHKLWACGTPPFPYYGLDEFLRMCESLDITPLICLKLNTTDRNTGMAGCPHDDCEGVDLPNECTGYPDDLPDYNEIDLAQDQIEYCNGIVGENRNGGEDWAVLRSQNGHPEPYNVKYWEVGNECYATSSTGHLPPNQYEPMVFQAIVERLKLYDTPECNICISSVAHGIFSDHSWNDSVFNTQFATGDHIPDFLHPHFYGSNFTEACWDLHGTSEMLYSGTMAMSQYFEEQLSAPATEANTWQQYIADLESLCSHDVKLSISEYDTKLNEGGHAYLGHKHSLMTALYCADFLRMLIGIVDGDDERMVHSAYLHHIGNLIGVSDDGDDFYRRPGFYAFQMFSKHFGSILSSLSTSGIPINSFSDEYDCEYYLDPDPTIDYPSITAVASTNSNHKVGYLIAINKDPISSQTVTIKPRNLTNGFDNVEVWLLTASDFDEDNEDNNNRFNVSTKKYMLTVTDGDFQYTLPPHSVASFRFFKHPNLLGIDRYLLVSPGPKGFTPARINMYSYQKNLVYYKSITSPFAGYFGGLNLACGDIDGDGIDEIVAGLGHKALNFPRVYVLEFDGTVIDTFLAYDTSYRYGVNVATANFGDTKDVILTGPGPYLNQPALVRGWEYQGGDIVPISSLEFLAYGAPHGGVNIAAGNINGTFSSDGNDEILTGPGPAEPYGTHLRGFDYENSVISPLQSVSEYIFPLDNNYGLNVATGHFDSFDYEFIFCTRGLSEQKDCEMKMYYLDSGILVPLTGPSFYPFAEEGYMGGMAIATGDLVDDPSCPDCNEIYCATGHSINNPIAVKMYSDFDNLFDSIHMNYLFAFEDAGGANICVGYLN